MDPTDRKLRYDIFTFILEKCRPPTIQDLVNNSGLAEHDVVQGLQRLQDLHHLKLYDDDVPSPTPIAMAHPFSHLPTPYVVLTQGNSRHKSEGQKSWWANCSWCAFGLAAMLSPAQLTVNSMTASGAECLVKVANGEIEDIASLQEYYVVFSAPPSKWWNDVRFACSSIQLCTSKQEAENWHLRHGFYKGDVISLESLWELSKAWYHDKHEYDYERMTPEEKERLFKSIGLVSSYWSS